MADWSRRIADLLGGPLAQATHDSLDRLVEAGVREDTDLDFKSAVYGGGDSQKREQAADIAAMGNARGGVIALGIEDQDGVAVGLPGVELSESHILRMKSSVAELVVPYVDFDVLPVEHRDSAGRGFYLVTIPPSAYRPHAVRKGNRDLRYPLRDGPHNRWLSESEVADMYRSRFTAAAAQEHRLEQMIAEAHRALDLEHFPWLSIALVPNNPGSMPLTLDTLAEYREFTAHHSGQGGGFDTRYFHGSSQVGAGLRRVTAHPHLREGEFRPRREYAEFHTDGSGLATSAMWWPEQTSPEMPLLIDNLVIFEMIAMLRLMGEHAVSKTGAYGEAAVQVEVLPNPKVMLVSGHGLEEWSDVNAPDRPVVREDRVRSQHTISLDDVTGSAQRLTATTALLLTDIWQAFGSPEIRQIATDGTLRVGHFSAGYRQNIHTWAQRAGIATAE